MKNDCIELPLMSIELCQKCRSIHTHEIKSSSISAWWSKAAGCQLLECKNCNHRWKEFLPMQLLLNLVYSLLAAEVVLLVMNYLNA